MENVFFNTNILECKEFKAFGFIDEIADTVFDLSILANEIRFKDRCRIHTRVLYPARTVKNTRLIRLTSTVVVRKVIRRSAPCFNPWASVEEKRLLHEAQSLGLKMFRIRRG